LRLAEQARSPYAEALVRSNLAIALAHTGSLGEAMELEKLAIAELERQGDVRLEAGARCALSDMLLSSGAQDAAEAEVRRALAAAGEHKPARASALAMLAHVLLSRNQYAEALAIAEEGMAILAHSAMEEREALLRVSYADALRRVGRLAEARAAIRSA